MILKAHVIPYLDVEDMPRRPQPRSGEDVQTQKEAVR